MNKKEQKTQNKNSHNIKNPAIMSTFSSYPLVMKHNVLMVEFALYMHYFLWKKTLSFTSAFSSSVV